ncbi:ABC-type glycerol-3-phosphate transport system permease component [Deinococcus metalli]|uniref:ABC-type glycerol-3-phosphate transport system permease component n=1 Tax=Deinococcus metalli TaxID=1141878 RepID=A0A7W8NN96_9DEIO|nr:carbohydrate ABC transporter permease [Deinococcus metalli]MBB5376669.1 ABC-type glycerol-3-phosphate transport system permease component [Deinococcus metalli]GHF42365.1 glycerol-3-phosphate ABC transporter permease [Deinococcus metalli]
MVGERPHPLLLWLLRLPFLALAVSVMIPYYWMATNAFKTIPEIIRNPPTWWIHTFTLDNFFNPDTVPGAARRSDEFQGVFQIFANTGFAQFYVNSVVITALTVTISLLLASLVAYVLVKHPFPGSQALFLVLLGSMMIPWEVTIIPNFLTVRDLGWINSYQALLFPGLAKAFAVFFFRQAILAIPDDLVDAARIDGAGELRIWWSIVLPMLRPALAAIAIPVMLGEWNNYLWPLLVINDDAHQTLPLALGKLAGNLTYDPRGAGPMMAASLLVSLPMVIIFLLFQRQFVQGLAAGATKG